MEAVFDISNIPKHLQVYIPTFADAVLLSIIQKMQNRIPKERLKEYGEELQNQKFISWTSSPKSISCNTLINLLCESIIYDDVDGKLVFKPNNHKNFPGTKTKMDLIFKFISYGNGELRGIHQIQDIFNEYDENLNQIWMDFIVQTFQEQGE